MAASREQSGLICLLGRVIYSALAAAAIPPRYSLQSKEYQNLTDCHMAFGSSLFCVFPFQPPESETPVKSSPSLKEGKKNLAFIGSQMDIADKNHEKLTWF